MKKRRLKKDRASDRASERDSEEGTKREQKDTRAPLTSQVRQAFCFGDRPLGA
jgi:hypothetical protein